MYHVFAWAEVAGGYVPVGIYDRAEALAVIAALPELDCFWLAW